MHAIAAHAHPGEISRTEVLGELLSTRVALRRAMAERFRIVGLAVACIGEVEQESAVSSVAEGEERMRVYATRGECVPCSRAAVSRSAP